MQRMTSDEWRDTTDYYKAQETPAVIRRESIIGMDRMSLAQKANLRQRIFKNHEISRAKANVASKLAGS